MGLEGNFRKSIDGKWLQEHEVDEIDYTKDSNKDSYDYLFDEDELFMIQQMQLKEQLAEEGYLEDDKASYEDSRGTKREMDDRRAESWNASDLGKYTIGTPTQEKKAAQAQERSMEPVSKSEFQDISDDVDREDAEMQRKLEEACQELEGIF